MDYKNLYQNKKLEQAVLTKSPEEISALYKQLEQVGSSARALGLACRFRGLEYVKALVEGGANFTFERKGYMITYYYWVAPLDINAALYTASVLISSDVCFLDKITEGEITYNVLPMEQRIDIVAYLYQNRERVCLDAEEMLYYSIMSGSKQITKVLKEFGVKFSQQRIEGMTEDGRSFEWQEFCSMVANLNEEEFFKAVGGIIDEIDGRKLHYTENFFYSSYNRNTQFRLYKPEFFRFLLEHFNQKKMNKTRLMKGAITENSVACLEICAENGWLAMPRKRDEMIEYASKNGKAECSAWLLEFKNRTADFAAEREKAEKKMMRELNANPNSVTELKKIWGYEKREDGNIIITRYKGKRTEIDVPEKIGNSIVTAIGEKAFSTKASRLKKEQIALRKSITRITLPETIRSIGEGAFNNCSALAEINIPDSVTAIGASAFSNCNSLESIRLPEGITEIGACTFDCCQSLKSVMIPQTVEIICKQAFCGCSALETVTISEGVVEIEQRAFVDCVSLKFVVLPQSIKKIKNFTRSGQDPQTIFHNDVNLTVTVPPKSYAEKYCKRNNITYTYSNGGM